MIFMAFFQGFVVFFNFEERKNLNIPFVHVHKCLLPSIFHIQAVERDACKY